MPEEYLRKIDREDMDISIFVSNETERDWRSKPNLHEPGTIEWLRTMRSGACYFDIGANVGVFTLIAGYLSRAVYILAIEPAPENVWRMHQNLHLNKLNGKVCVLGGAIAERSGIGKISSLERFPGGSDHRVGWAEKDNTRRVPCFSLDDLVYKLGYLAPTHIKIDVDGTELSVISGASRLLAKNEIESINIEVDALSESASIIDQKLCHYGFRFVRSYFDPLAAAEEPDQIKIENRIYTRDAESG